MNAEEVLNTPGYYYAIAYMLSVVVITNTNEKKYSSFKLAGVQGMQFALLLALMVFTDGIRQMLFLPTMALIIGLLFFSVYSVCRLSGQEAGFYCVKAFISGEFAASLCWQIYFFFAGYFTKYPIIWRWMELAAVYGIIFSVLYVIEKHLKKDMEELHVTGRELLVVIIVAGSVFAVSNMSYLDAGGLFSGSYARDIFIIRTLVDLSGTAMIYAYHLQLKEMHLHFEKETLQGIMELQYQNYQISRENIDLVNRKYHDLKHQIILLKTQSYAEMGKSTQYLEKMEKEIRGYEAQNKTGNAVLDAVLSSKSLVCQKQGIELKFMADGEALSFMEDMDISALFGNMLDNAIESVQKLKEQEKRLVWLYIIREKQFIRIRTENYCDEKITFRDGMPVTTKTDKHLHGFGMKSIRATVEKYGGSVVASQKNNWFQLKILIPLQTEKILLRNC